MFLGHAQLYVLAEKYDITALKSLTLMKLHSVLNKFKLSESRYTDILELAYYTYEHTPCTARMGPLREMITRYLAYNAKAVINSPYCRVLVAKGGDFAADLMAMVIESAGN